MLGRKDFTADEVSAARSSMAETLAAFATAGSPAALEASISDHRGVFTTDTVITYRPESSVLGLRPGDRISLTAESFTRLTEAFFADLEAMYR